MPLGDGTGPMGLGPMTGRAAGFCSGFGMPGFANPIPRRWFGFGWGWGAPYVYPYASASYMGYGYPYYSPGYIPPYGYPYYTPGYTFPYGYPGTTAPPRSQRR